MDKTLADYITRTMARLEMENQKPAINDTHDEYLVYPEKRGEDSDEKINPFSKV